MFTDYGAESISSHIGFALSSGDYYAAFNLLLDDTELFLSEAFKNVPFDENNPTLLVNPIIWQIIVVILLSGGMVYIVLHFMNKRKKGL